MTDQREICLNRLARQIEETGSHPISEPSELPPRFTDSGTERGFIQRVMHDGVEKQLAIGWIE